MNIIDYSKYNISDNTKHILYNFLIDLKEYNLKTATLISKIESKHSNLKQENETLFEKYLQNSNNNKEYKSAIKEELEKCNKIKEIVSKDQIEMSNYEKELQKNFEEYKLEIKNQFTEEDEKKLEELQRTESELQEKLNKQIELFSKLEEDYKSSIKGISDKFNNCNDTKIVRFNELKDKNQEIELLKNKNILSEKELSIKKLSLNLEKEKISRNRANFDAKIKSFNNDIDSINNIILILKDKVDQSSFYSKTNKEINNKFLDIVSKNNRIKEMIVEEEQKHNKLKEELNNLNKK